LLSSLNVLHLALTPRRDDTLLDPEMPFSPILLSITDAREALGTNESKREETRWSPGRHQLGARV
jgi:hypothetical protein